VERFARKGFVTHWARRRSLCQLYAAAGLSLFDIEINNFLLVSPELSDLEGRERLSAIIEHIQNNVS
jgi:hypothetical protein